MLACAVCSSSDCHASQELEELRLAHEAAFIGVEIRESSVSICQNSSMLFRACCFCSLTHDSTCPLRYWHLVGKAMVSMQMKGVWGRMEREGKCFLGRKRTDEKDESESVSRDRQ